MPPYRRFRLGPCRRIPLIGGSAFAVGLALNLRVWVPSRDESGKASAN
jgi:hypothetical protein